jgi:hypothetical protein
VPTTLETLLLAVASVACLACSSPAEQTPKPEPEPVVAASPANSTETGQPEAAPAPALDDDVIEIAAPDGAREPKTVPIRPITATPANVTWREVARFTEDLEFVPVTSGVVARSSAGVHELVRGELVLRSELTLPDAPLLGHWPDDVWALESKQIDISADGTRRFEYQLSRLDRERRWVAQPYKNQTTWTGEPLAARKGWLAGVLVREGSALTRVGSRKQAPKVGLRMGKIILDVFESSSGRIYNISLRPTGVYVQQACYAQKCVDEHAKRLPFGSEWSFAAQIPRQRHSLTVVAISKSDGAAAHHLLHYELGGWSLEPLTHEPTGMWPSADGGLWVLSKGALRYRTARGEWFDLALPEGLSRISAAVRKDLQELWVAGKLDGESVVFATTGVS